MSENSGNDRRLTVTRGGVTYRILRSAALGWCIYTGADLDLVGFGFASPDEAVAALPNAGPGTDRR
ncbi:MAG TPA: hypothetical protein VFM55_19575 [Micromonosporaceae bacterium]|nr:hypothetical protein [Micromonosporaceae bacterium]